MQTQPGHKKHRLLLWCAALLVSSLPTICQLFSRQLQTANVQVQAELWTQLGRHKKGVSGEDTVKTQVKFFRPRFSAKSGWWAALEGKDNFGTVWQSMEEHGVVNYVYGETIPLAHASCASVRAFMRGPFVLDRQAHKWVNELEQWRPSSMVAVCLHRSLPSYFISSPAHRQPLMS